MKVKLVYYLFLVLFMVSSISAQNCLKCHQKITPQAVTDWQLSKHAENGISCEDCHGSNHNSLKNVNLVELPTYQTCAQCHDEQTEQFKKGKHAIAWAAMKAMPTFHMQPMEMTEGMKGCGGCHKQGIKSEEEIQQLKEEGSVYGHASCDACHTRHTFSAEEARQPEACQTCHTGFDHAQWEMYSGSKHGVRYKLKRAGVLPEDAAAPTCQTCHMPDGNHEVRTAWGFLAVKLPMPEDEQWTSDRATILQALGVLDPDGNPTALLDVVKAADVARLTQEDWDKERKKMIKVCGDCHSEKFATGELQKGDNMIKEADHLMAKSIRTVAELYKDKIIEKPESYAYAFPQLLTFHDALTSIEQKLFVMFLKHRMRTFQGTFHANPDYALWYGWSEMVRDVAEINELAEQMRLNKKLAEK